LGHSQTSIVGSRLDRRLRAQAKADGAALPTAAIARNILNAKELPHDPDLVATVAGSIAI
jgi:hypothetical protein